MRLTRCARNLLISMFRRGRIRVDNPMLSLTHRRGNARKLLLAKGLLEVEKQWIQDDKFCTLCRLSDSGHREVLRMMSRRLTYIYPLVISGQTELIEQFKAEFLKGE